MRILAYTIPPFKILLQRGLKGVCPSCGKSSLFEGYMRVKKECPHCHLALSSFKSDDIPAYITIVLVGHIVVPLISLSMWSLQWDLWFLVAFWIFTSTLLTLSFLRPVKGVVLALLWKVRG